MLCTHDEDAMLIKKGQQEYEEVVFVRLTGGEVGVSSSLAPKIGPLGLLPKKVGEDIAKETAKD
ncbi:hypothetical protein GOP47_0011345 [Adiantum capillus-veneris]|uniref:Large ribosomal subunit protein uL11 N-terminal domain-containing protein n=1 Tax=Adiantum capillus-veneris TaxID=13818 RepID=A0A9D4UTS6_ADICA|nr:hypothetical protein GOP47_0011345 [Adiantum capillus-veneris]